MSFLDKIFGKSRATKTKNSSAPKKRRLGFEGLENRELLAVYTVDSLADYDVAYNDAHGGWYYYDDNSSNPIEHEGTTLRMAVAKTLSTAEDDTIEIVVSGTITLQKAIALTAGYSPISPPGALREPGTLNIIGLGADRTTVEMDESATGLDVSHIFVCSVNDVAISGMSLRGVKSQSGLDGRLITATGALTLKDVDMSNGNFGSAIETGGGDTVLENCTINNNITSAGAIWSYGGSLTVINSTISGNTSSSWGAAINLSASHEGGMQVSGCTITNNESIGGGGGIYTHESSGVIVIENSLISGNEWHCKISK